MAETAQANGSVAPVEAPAAPVVEASKRARGKSGKFVSGPGNPEAFDRAFDEAYAREVAALGFGEERRDEILSLAEPAKKEQPEEATKVAPAGKTESPKPDSAAVTAVKIALRKLQVPSSVVESVSETNLAEWQGVASQVATHDATYRELGELRRPPKESPAPVKESDTSDQTFDLDSELQTFDTTLDEDAAKAVGNVLKRQQAHNDAKIASLEKRLAAVVPEIEQSRAARLGKIADDTRAELGKRFPQLSDDAFFKGTILPAMAQLNSERKDGTRPYSDAGKLMTDACRLQGLSETAEPQLPPQTPRPKRPASPITDTFKPATGPMTWDKAADLALAGLQKGLSEREVRAQLRR